MGCSSRAVQNLLIGLLALLYVSAVSLIAVRAAWLVAGIGSLDCYAVLVLFVGGRLMYVAHLGARVFSMRVML